MQGETQEGYARGRLPRRTGVQGEQMRAEREVGRTDAGERCRREMIVKEGGIEVHTPPHRLQVPLTLGVRGAGSTQGEGETQGDRETQVREDKRRIETESKKRAEVDTSSTSLASTLDIGSTRR